MELLQAASINPIAKITGPGVVIWGARTFLDAKNDSEWRYVPVRRVALLIEESVYRGLRWAVFEPNGEVLWAQIRLVVSSFMHQLFRSGAFQGAAPAQAYFVKCGRDTMTQADIEHGRIVLDIGFAPLKPAEFVILKVTLKTACGGGPP
jgi:phage tail sheath protein FI